MNNKYFKRILLSLALLGGVTASISAQGLRSSYFLAVLRIRKSQRRRTR